MSLTHGAISTIVRLGGDAENFHPTVQVINVKAVGAVGGSTPDRYRIILSDGDHFVQGMVAKQLNSMIHNGAIQENTLIQLNEHMINNVSGRIVVIVLKIDVLQTLPHRIGGDQVRDIEKSGIAKTSPTSATSAPPMYGNSNMSRHSNMSGSRMGGSAGLGGGAKPVSPSNPYGASRSSSYQNSGSAPIVRDAAANNAYTPIDRLNMYQNRWTIKARLTNKSDIKTWSNAKGEGSLFSIELLDSSGMDIRATFFKEAVDKFYNTLEVNKVYTFSGGKLKVANQQWNTCKSQFEITFDVNHTEIHLADDGGDIAEQTYDFVKIADVEQQQENKLVDVLVIVKSVGEPATLVSKKTGRDVTKCDLVVVDDSGVDINLTTWGEQALKAPTDFANQPLVAFRRVRVSDYGGKSLNTSMGGAVVPNPSVPEAATLRSWFQQTGGAVQNSLSRGGGGGGKIASFSERKTIEAITNENMGQSPDTADVLTFKATLTFIKKDKEGGAWYPACPNAGEPCKNRYKVTQTTDQRWYCDKCAGTFDNCVRRWIFSGTATDDTSTTWVSFFDDQAKDLIGDGITADDVYAQCLDDTGGLDQDKYDGYFTKPTHSEWVMKVKVKADSSMDNDGQARIKKTVLALQPMDYAKESKDILDALQRMS